MTIVEVQSKFQKTPEQVIIEGSRLKNYDDLSMDIRIRFDQLEWNDLRHRTCQFNFERYIADYLAEEFNGKILFEKNGWVEYTRKHPGAIF